MPSLERCLEPVLMPKNSKSPLRVVAKGRNLTFSIVNDLGAAIVAGKFSKKNSFPIEAELCVRYGASRSVLREAVKMLTAKGLLTSRQRHGTWVLPEDSWNLLDPDVLGWVLDHKDSSALRLEFGETRLAVECAAAALAAVRGSFQQKSAIDRALARVIAAEHGEDDPLKACTAFHVTLLKASGNRFLMQFQQLIETALETAKEDAAIPLDVEGYRKIFNAVIAGDADAAYRTTRTLIAQAMEQPSRENLRRRTRV
jgi:DNA-binding FadR family transcriptional regulator